MKDRIKYATNWVNDFKAIEEKKIKLTKEQKAALKVLIKNIEGLDDSDAIQSTIFETARDNEIKPRDFFKLLYQILLNTDRGPKLGPYIQTIGTKHAISSLKKNLK